MAGKVHQYNMARLHKFVKAVSDEHVVKIGIFGGTHEEQGGRKALGALKKHGGHEMSKKNATLTNAEIGAIHEFGAPGAGIPMRSFLRMPMHIKSRDIIQQGTVGAAAHLANNEPLKILIRLGIACENVIQDAFSSGGFGFWKFILPSTVRRKGSARELIDTGQLRRSITSKVGTPE